MLFKNKLFCFWTKSSVRGLHPTRTLGGLDRRDSWSFRPLRCVTRRTKSPYPRDQIPVLVTFVVRRRKYPRFFKTNPTSISPALLIKSSRVLLFPQWITLRPSFPQVHVNVMRPCVCVSHVVGGNYRPPRTLSWSISAYGGLEQQRWEGIGRPRKRLVRCGIYRNTGMNLSPT